MFLGSTRAMLPLPLTVKELALPVASSAPAEAEALRGEVVAHAAEAPGQPDKAEHMLMGLRPSEYIENYVPVVDESGNKVVAVVELYRTATGEPDPALLQDRLVDQAEHRPVARCRRSNG